MRTFRTTSLRYSLASIWISCRAMSSTSPVGGTRRIAAVAQLRSTSSKFRNLLDVAECARLAKLQNAAMLILPECLGFFGSSATETLEHAEKVNLEDEKVRGEAAQNPKNDRSVSEALRTIVSEAQGAELYKRFSSQAEQFDKEGVHIVDGLKEIARESGLWLSAGGVHIAGAPPDDNNDSDRPRLYNTHIIVDGKGIVKAFYRKIHLFDISIPGKVNLQESACTAPGTQLVVCDSPLGKLGVSLCYDVRFPELYIELVKAGAQILLVPAAFTVPTGLAHWHTLLQARAIEGQCYVLAAAQYGKHNEKRESFGHSLAIDPWGKIVADAGGYASHGDASVEEIANRTPTIITCDIDHELIESVRRNIPIQMHRSKAKYSF